MNLHEVFIHIHQGCFAGTGAIVRLPQCQWSKPDGYGKISPCITTTKHSIAKTVCTFLGIYCTWTYLTATKTYFFNIKTWSHINGCIAILIECECDWWDTCRSITCKWMYGGRDNRLGHIVITSEDITSVPLCQTKLGSKCQRVTVLTTQLYISPRKKIYTLFTLYIPPNL